MRAQTVVVGAGVIGLAIARALAHRGHDVVVLEAEEAYGQHASSRNSEVIHAGLYYPPGSLKARLCNAGRPQLVALCRDHDVEHHMVGKLIVATEPAEVTVLERIARNASHCGGGALQWLDAAQVQQREPALKTCGALWSPETGIVDSHGVMRTLLRDAQAHGAMLALKTQANSLHRAHNGFVLQTSQGPLFAENVIVSAGAGAQALATTLEDLDPKYVPRRYLAKGTYAKLRGPSPCSTLVYPVPDSASLGVHLTLDLAGAARFGPDQEWVENPDLAVDPARLHAFVPAVRRYWPGLPQDALVPDYAGIRVKTQAPGTPMADFTLLGPANHGLAGLVLLFGIESPGLTSALALADEVALHLDTP
ncbi:MAG: NAD(P)/FAD-dependent oxidoreductase [Nannocystales bacterium]